MKNYRVELNAWGDRVIAFYVKAENEAEATEIGWKSLIEDKRHVILMVEESL